MAKDWVKLSRRILESEDLADLHDHAARAEAVFYRLLAASDDFGRLPGDPRILCARIRPLSVRGAADLEKDVERLASRGMVFYYEIDGKRCLQITNYEQYQERESWTQMSSDYPAPPDYVPPQALLDFIANATDRRYNRRRYGLPETAETKHPEIPTGRDMSEPVGLGRTEIPVKKEKEKEKKDREDAPPAADASLSSQESDSRRDNPAYDWAAQGPLRIALKQAQPLLAEDKRDMDKWGAALLRAARDTAYPLDVEGLCAALLANPPTANEPPKSWITDRQWEIRAQKRQADSPSSADWDRYAEPAGTNWGPQINRAGGPWKHWAFAADGEEYKRRSRLWGEAIRLAEAGDFSVLDAGPQVEAKV